MYNLNLNMSNMNAKTLMVFLLAVISVAFMASFASAATLDVTSVTIDDIASGDAIVGAGEIVPVEVFFRSDGTSVGPYTVSVWVQGAKSETLVEKTYNFNLEANTTKQAKFSVLIPSDLDNDDEVKRTLTLVVEVETDEDRRTEEFEVMAQRETNKLNVLLVDLDNSARPGATVPVSVVIRNAGSYEADDVFVTVRISELGISKTVFLEDLFPVDECGFTNNQLDCESDNDRFDDNRDSVEGRVFLTIPENAEPGVYQVEITAESDDSETRVVRPLTIMETPVEGKVLANPVSKTFSVGETVTYQMILVNSGREIAVYNLVPEASDALSISLSDTLVAVPAGTSKTVELTVKANREGTFNFAVNAISDGGFTESATYSAAVEGRSSPVSGSAGSNVVVLTIVLAIIFVVLLIVLIVLLTRKPEKSEEFGESYY